MFRGVGGALATLLQEGVVARRRDGILVIDFGDFQYGSEVVVFFGVEYVVGDCSLEFDRGLNYNIQYDRVKATK